MQPPEPKLPTRSRLRWRFSAVLCALVVGVATWLLSEDTRGTPVRAAGVLQVIPAGDVGTGRLTRHGDRVHSPAEQSLLFSYQDRPVEVSVVDLQGRAELLLGRPDGPSGALGLETGATLRVRRADGQVREATFERPPAGRITLRHEGGSYHVLVDGQPLARPIEGPAPVGASGLRVWPRTSFAALSSRDALAHDDTIDGDDTGRRLARSLWAALTTGLGLSALVAWWGALSGRRRPPVGSKLLAATVTLVLVAGLLATLHERNAPRLLRAPPGCASEPYERPGTVDLELGRPLDLHPRRDGDFVLTAVVELAERSVVDVVVRATPPSRDQGLAVTLSSDPALPGGVSVNLGTRFVTTPASEAAARTLDAGRPLALRIECQGPSLAASVDGVSLGTTHDLDLRAGRTIFQALAGRARLSELRIEPSGPPGDAGGTLTAWMVAVGLALGVGLALLVVATGGSVAGVLWAWPLAAAVAPGAPPGGDALALPAGVVLLAVTLLVRRRVLGWLVGGAVLGTCTWALAQHGHALSPALLNELTVLDVRGGPIPERFVWSRHPVCRRFNPFVRDQTFRGQRVALGRRPGTARIVTLGSSSTFGYGVRPTLNYPSRLAARLTERGRDVEVLNAGVPAATAERLRLFLVGVLLDFAPDLVIVNLSFNDHTFGGLVDEPAHFAALTTTGISLIDSLGDRLEGWVRRRGWRRFAPAWRQGRAVDAEQRELYLGRPARRFAESLGGMVTAARDAGVRVLLVQEPRAAATGRSLIAPYHEAMAEVGEQMDVAVVDPGPDLAALGPGAFIDAVHPTPEGHDVLAARLAEEILARGLLEGTR